MNPSTSIGIGLLFIAISLSAINVYHEDGIVGVALFLGIWVVACVLVWRLLTDVMNGKPWRCARIRAYLLMVRREIFFRRSINREHMRYVMDWLDERPTIQRSEVQWAIEWMQMHGAEPCDIARAVDHWKRGVLFIPSNISLRRPYL